MLNMVGMAVLAVGIVLVCVSIVKLVRNSRIGGNRWGLK